MACESVDLSAGWCIGKSLLAEAKGQSIRQGSTTRHPQRWFTVIPLINLFKRVTNAAIQRRAQLVKHSRRRRHHLNADLDSWDIKRCRLVPWSFFFVPSFFFLYVNMAVDRLCPVPKSYRYSGSKAHPSYPVFLHALRISRYLFPSWSVQ